MRLPALPAIYPPRPLGSISPSTVASYRGYVAQYKFNDIRLLIQIDAKGKVSLLSRRREPLLSYSLTPAAKKSLASLDLPKGYLHLLDGGLMRSTERLPGRQPIVLWDILVHSNDYLIGSTYEARYKLLRKICGDPTKRETESGSQLALSVGPELWLVDTFKNAFAEHYNETLPDDRLEGIMMKDPKGRLEWGASEENNGRWQIRVRKPSGRHVF